MHFLNFVEDCLGYVTQNFHLQPCQSFQVELETHHAKGGDAASKARYDLKLHDLKSQMKHIN